ncbi:MAG TPA: PEP-CTERM sorting domain-containing protein [Opitutaceae bacterium]|nr:PEP-CTERM sorting domain-containing protein [Opitutaceae bacterium]
MIGALGALPLAASAASSGENHGSTTGQNNASANGVSNSNPNGIGGGTAPVPEASTWAAMGAAVLVGGALVARRRRLQLFA